VPDRLANGGMRAASGFDADDTIRGQGLHAHQGLGILLGIDVVGDDGDRETLPHRLAELFRQRRLAGADRPADPDAQGSIA
jgi:hypothetical protein